MSTLSTIKTDVEKFLKGSETDLEKFAAEFEKIFGKLPSALQTVKAFVAVITPEIETAANIADPVLEPAVAEALQTVEVGLTAVETAAEDATDGQSLLANIKSFAADVPSLLTGLDVKDATLQSTITGIVNFVSKESGVLIPLVESWVAELTPPPAAPAIAA